MNALSYVTGKLETPIRFIFISLRGPTTKGQSPSELQLAQSKSIAAAMPKSINRPVLVGTEI